ncbi:MAG: Asp23/Gls24 family envelope stress response protein [Defluviitaleaceae bacterium]|nr:Asp23/Gls24 family envelope stress response protein [Defluviitaleaceae bacterium]
MPLGSRFRAKNAGKVNYSFKVLHNVISLASLEVKGVAKLEGRGVRTEEGLKDLSVDVFISVVKGIRCTEVAFLVQENVKKALETMTDKKVGRINVHVMGIEEQCTTLYTQITIENGEELTSKQEEKNNE